MAAGATYEPIATTTLGSAANSITFSSIPSTYTDLKIVLVTTGVGGNYGVGLQFNSDTASNYSYTSLYGDGSAAGSGSSGGGLPRAVISVGTIPLSTPALYIVNIFSYAGSTYKTVLSTEAGDKNAAGGYVSSTVNLWRNTVAINTVKILVSNASYNFAIGTTATLYGIKAA